MPTFKVNVKWGKEKFTGVECNTDEPPVVFKAQLFALSGVAPDRQKVMMKGIVLKDDEWGKLKLKDGAMLLMMGSADELPSEPAEKPVFVEDMSDSQLAKALEMPSGLTNLGNTCYMNATLQCFRSVPELCESLKKYANSLLVTAASSPDQSISAAIRDLFETMDSTSTSVPPIVMLRVLHMCFPQFSEKSEQGGFQQQDANECWTELMRCLQKQLPALEPSPSQGTEMAAAASNRQGFVDQYFGGEFAITMKCVESEDEPASHSSETFYQLSCFIEKEVKYMHTGLKMRLEEHITKNSPTLARDAQYHKTCKVSRLPAYLPIQMVRFFYKEKEAINAKILKDIKFPMMLDMFEMCTDELQQKLIPAREAFKAEEDRQVMLHPKAKKGEKPLARGDEKKRITTRQPYAFPDDVGSNNSGYYELQAVLTHKGRSSSSGHYVGWVRRKEDEWLMFDDDNVQPVLAEDVMKLSGGGDWHCAYVLLYGPRILEIEELTEEEIAEAAAKKAEEEKNKEETPMES